MADSSSISSPNTLVTDGSPVSAMLCSPSQCNRNEPSNSYNGCYYKGTPDVLNRSYNLTVKLMSPAASSGPFCRICHEGDSVEDLVSLCRCTGSVGLVHLSCMERWLSTRRGAIDKCEICNYKFNTIRSPKSILEWYHSEQGNAGSRQGILGDLACFSLISPLSAVCAFLCFKGVKQQVIWNNSLEAGCLMALGTFLITMYMVWNILTFRFHFRSYLRWRAVNQNVRLIRFRRRSTNAADQRNVRNIAEQSDGNGLSTLPVDPQESISALDPAQT